MMKSTEKRKLNTREITEKPRRTHCKNGHEFTEWNTKWHIGDSGKPARKCRLCNNARYRLKYNSDPAFREAKKKYAKEYRNVK